MCTEIKKIWYNLSDKIRFLLVGTLNAGISYLIYAGLLYFVFGERYYQLSLALAWLLSSVISFTTQKTFVFETKGNILKQYFKCCLIWFLSYCMNAVLLFLLVKKLSVNAYLSQVLATAICAIFNYILFKIFAFRRF